VARLKGREDGPVLGYLSHVDTVLADPADWSADPWGGEVRDGYLWGRGALDMKSQTAAEAVAAARLARNGGLATGELKVISVADEETGGTLGAKWLTEEHADLARCDYLLNEGGGAVMPLGDRRFYGVCCAEKGTFRFAVRTRGTAGHASTPAVADNALLKLAPVIERLGAGRPRADLTEEPRALLAAIGEDPDDPDAAVERLRTVEPFLAAMVDPTLRITLAPTIVSAGEKINVIPARAEVRVDCRTPPGMGAEATLARIHEVLGEVDGLEIEFTEQVVGNRSPLRSPLMDAIADWVGAQDPGAQAVPVVLPAFTDSRWFRAAFPDCVAYGFFPQRHQTLYETWPLVHGADERIDVRDLGFATAFFHDLPGRLLR
jgi:acetylornithine deacetylase/succinyl-diaminopimelate desuccinylase-like protein